MFGKITSIDPANKDWQRKIYLTLDIDWAHDKIVSDSVDLIEGHGVEATWFITNTSPTLFFVPLRLA
jgi:hypothetical protein